MLRADSLPFEPPEKQHRVSVPSREHKVLLRVMGIKCLETEILLVSRVCPKVVTAADKIAIKSVG